MHIKVKGVNNHLVFVFDDSQEFNSLLQEFKSLLESPLLKSDGYYPKAFFDFQSRILSADQLIELLDLLFEKQVLLFAGVKLEKKEKKNKIKVINQTVHAGEVLELDQDTLIIGQINPGAIVRFVGKLYVLGRVSGFIEGLSANARVSGQCFKNAHIRINGVSRHNYTSYELTMLYYKDSQIFLDKGDMIYV
ncbi:septum site-determining protein MinC [uncultured Thomasclavelia sp.]|uniref:septum site-determining protein MinC n=1 Tax=uncultured Thomasclavelia sp. TaxID=3025759 RepID=UPI0025F98D62|nr:septum site-determining protein MinC [uncultured Thomasclavelia sp.]